LPGGFSSSDRSFRPGILQRLSFLFSYVADHFQYLASLGPIVMVAAGFAWLVTRASPLVRAGACGLGVLLIAVLAVLANQQSRSYRDGETLYRATLERNPDCWMAHINLASELAKSPGARPRCWTIMRRRCACDPTPTKRTTTSRTNS